MQSATTVHFLNAVGADIRRRGRVDRAVFGIESSMLSLLIELEFREGARHTYRLRTYV